MNEESANGAPRGVKRAMDVESDLESAGGGDSPADTLDRKRLKKENSPADRTEDDVSEAGKPEAPVAEHSPAASSNADGQDFFKPMAVELHQQINERLLTNDPGAYASDITSLAMTDRLRNGILYDDENVQSRLNIIKDVRAVHDKVFHGSADGFIPEDIVGQCAAAEFFSISRREKIADLVCDGGEFSQRWFQEPRIQKSISTLIEKVEYYNEDRRDKIYGCALMIRGERDEIVPKLFAQRQHFNPEQQDRILQLYLENAPQSLTSVAGQHVFHPEHEFHPGHEHAAKRQEAIDRINAIDMELRPQHIQGLLREAASFEADEIRGILAATRSITDLKQRAKVYLAFTKQMRRDERSPSRMPSDVMDSIIGEARSFKERNQAPLEAGPPSPSPRSPSPVPSDVSVSIISEAGPSSREDASPLVAMQRVVSEACGARWALMMNTRPRKLRGD